MVNYFIVCFFKRQRILCVEFRYDETTKYVAVTCKLRSECNLSFVCFNFVSFWKLVLKQEKTHRIKKGQQTTGSLAHTTNASDVK